MTKDKKFYQSICEHDFELKNMFGEMTYETCKVCNLNVSRRVCVLCNGPILADPDGWAGGHNAQPVATGKCCGPCNRIIVEPAQMRQAIKNLDKRN